MHVLIRREEVTRRTGLARSTIYKWIDLGEFPKPIKITERSSAWLESEIDEWIAKKAAQRGA